MQVELKVIRFKFTENSTIGYLYLNNTLFGYTLEDVDRGLTSEMSLEEINKIKQYSTTCIPYGTYKISLYESPKHGLCPLLHDVKGYSMVEIHKGNFPKDTLGCILVGTSYSEDRINNSRVAFANLMEQLENAETITITISKTNKA